MKEEVKKYLEYLDEERKLIWEKLNFLQALVEKKTSDYEEEAKQSATQANDYRNIADEAKGAVLQAQQLINSTLEQVKVSYSNYESISSQINQLKTSAEENTSAIQNHFINVSSQAETIKAKIAEIEKVFEAKPALDERIAKLSDIFTRGDDYDSKLSTLHKSILERKKEIDELYYLIAGSTIKDESGADIEVIGLRGKLEEAYDALESDLQKLSEEFATLRKTTTERYDSFIGEKEVTFNTSYKKWQDEYQSTLKTLEDLLPRALTTGLSYAYSEKKVDEIKESGKLSITFNIAVVGLILVSLIPFGVSIYSIVKGVTLDEVIFRIPRLVVAILPLYVPVLWVAYSANKKLNLSKRLIEEYTHKEVLSKTVEGLSKQINAIDDKDISSDLRTKLLYNILEVNSENPGKLISDYNKSDHPLMDALDKSIKLTNAVNKLAKLPGFSKLATTLDKKSKEILKEQSEKANAGLNGIPMDNPPA